MSHVHDRMPVILAQEDFSPWLDCDEGEPLRAEALLKPAPEAALELTPIGTAVNRVANDEAKVQAPTGDSLRAGAE